MPSSGAIGSIGRICNRCTGFVAMATYVPNAKCQRGRMYTLYGLLRPTLFVRRFSEVSLRSINCKYNPLCRTLLNIIFWKMYHTLARRRITNRMRVGPGLHNFTRKLMFRWKKSPELPRYFAVRTNTENKCGRYLDDCHMPPNADVISPGRSQLRAQQPR